MPDGSVKSKSKVLKTNLKFKYMPGFGNDFETEALAGALPQGMNSPQKCAYGLYAEQLSGTPFTAPRARNERTWCYSCLLYTSPSPRDRSLSRMPSSA